MTIMRMVAAAVTALCVCGPGWVGAQTSTDPDEVSGTAEGRRQRFSVQASAGPTIIDSGHTLSAAVGYSPTSWLELLLNAERTHVPLYTTQHSGGYSITRGGTRSYISAEARFSPLPEARVSPFAMTGVGGGISRPNVTDAFPDRVTNDLRVVYVGGGVRIPVGHGISLTGDARAMVAVEGYDSVAGVWPVRVGVSWQF